MALFQKTRKERRARSARLALFYASAPLVKGEIAGETSAAIDDDRGFRCQRGSNNRSESIENNAWCSRGNCLRDGK